MNKLIETLKIKYPIIQGGMGNISNAPLTAAVSEAGGLGTIGAGTMTPKEVEEIVLETKKRTSNPFALNIPINVTPHVKELVEIAIKHEVKVVSLSAGNPSPIIPSLHDHGIKVIVVVGAVKQAKKAEQAGADVIVAEGYEAAGINSTFETTTLTLIPQIVDAVDVPVVAAGGIGDGRGLAAVLALGAQGVQMGTRFIATQEAPFHKQYKNRVVDAHDSSTIIVGRKYGRIRRVMNTDYAQKLLECEQKGVTLEEFANMTSEEQHKIGALLGDEQRGFMNSGQISGMISSVPSVAQLLQTMMDDARTVLSNLNNSLS
ncbi:2-nitropropane dioxygenase [Lottiidibacillus patelloidae]|uniref:Probable nitronate monooxygenase n=1 Tax=Lottiidibacillus patelloidae TaxID=2670334 RepID=A0A263BWR4_9BACI|nr:nitronate monooxygenase [Lottiidibacillus patelloidae]OZM58183.1 2-nitropropane dioxygenase [Lottiidibacillus patelloidae]